LTNRNSDTLPAALVHLNSMGHHDRMCVRVSSLNDIRTDWHEHMHDKHEHGPNMVNDSMLNDSMASVTALIFEVLHFDSRFLDLVAALLALVA
jgi:hypothetical protein